MKTYLKIFALIMISCATALAEPQTITHQGLLTSPSGTPLDTVVSVAFKLYNNVDSPTPFWSEVQSVTIAGGLYDVALGTVTPFPGDFLNDGTTWLGITVGEDAEMLPRSMLRSVPFAFRVRTVDDASGGDIASDVLIRGKLTVGNFNTNTGTQAFVSGNQSTASGDYSTASGQQCTASGPYSTVCGGLNNLASGDFSNIGGGSVQEAGGNYSTISGGHFNNAAGLYSTISGGQYNFATVDHATVGGGKGNHAYAEYSTVSGGGYNYARGQLSVIAGGGGDEAADSNSAQGNLSVIGGGYHNYATGDAACIAGGYYHTASGNSATIGGGYRNTSTSLYTTVGGGTYNNVSGQYSTIAGGRYNYVNGSRSTIAGGSENSVAGTYSFVGGGDSNAVHSFTDYATIAGGRINQVSGDFSGILGGRGNRVFADGSVICGGDNQGIADSSNMISSDLCFIGGGISNEIDSLSRGSVIAGGSYNEIRDGHNGTIGGGLGNEVSGASSTIPGGLGNTISGYESFACGKSTNVSANNSIVFGDGSEPFSIGMSNSANFLVTNGFRIWTDNPVSSNIGVRVVGGGTSWISLCDSTTKMNRTHADGNAILDRISAMPIDQWNYKHQPDGPEHIGPMAQDFWTAFHLGTDSLGIETLDADGVLFAAVKELAKQNQEMKSEIVALRALLQSQRAGDKQTKLEVEK